MALFVPESRHLQVAKPQAA